MPKRPDYLKGNRVYLVTFPKIGVYYVMGKSAYHAVMVLTNYLTARRELFNPWKDTGKPELTKLNLEHLTPQVIAQLPVCQAIPRTVQ